MVVVREDDLHLVRRASGEPARASAVRVGAGAVVPAVDVDVVVTAVRLRGRAANLAGVDLPALEIQLQADAPRLGVRADLRDPNEGLAANAVVGLGDAGESQRGNGKACEREYERPAYPPSSLRRAPGAPAVRQWYVTRRDSV
jgi:hypothetical protein